MKSRSNKILTVGLVVVAILVIVASIIFSQQRTQRNLVEQSASYQGKAADISSANREYNVSRALKSFENDRSSTTALAYLHYVLADGQTPTVYGLNMTNNKVDWLPAGLKLLSEQKLSDITYKNGQIKNQSTADIIDQNLMSQLNTNEAQLMLVALPIEADYQAKISAEEAAGHVESIYRQIRRKNPQSEIIFILPPTEDEELSQNQAYQDYINSFIELANVNVYDLSKNLAQDTNQAALDLHQNLMNTKLDLRAGYQGDNSDVEQAILAEEAARQAVENAASEEAAASSQAQEEAAAQEASRIAEEAAAAQEASINQESQVQPDYNHSQDWNQGGYEQPATPPADQGQGNPNLSGAENGGQAGTGY
ncbi:hypothetical protein SAMN04487985_11354 [Aerococcus urinaehominis]|uniref:hypothetical protein n=1 Tax=Aerococcus urinaehominis TaxID=128944 RepID=UPI0008914790|nr:hypothetical protein [Aerococcus urinaehominis]SDM35561.1 hypothetical protein SAMN04487985_11354 [Aerococcus urinaehominis]